MTIGDFILEQRKILDQLNRDNKPLRIAAQVSHVEASKRIFSDSEDVNGNKITYKFPSGRSTPQGRPRPRKGAYSKAYAEFRDKKGRTQIDMVDFTLEGDFRKDYMNSESEVVNTAKPLKISPDEYQVQLKRSKDGISHAELRDVFENSYYKTRIFTLSEREKEVFFETAELELKKLLE